MKKIHVILSFILVSIVVLSMLVGGCSTDTTSKFKVVTTTALIQEIVERVGGNYVSVSNVIPPAQCPGHFDVKPGDIQSLATADLFLMHGWQGEKFSQSLIDSVNNTTLSVIKINISGNWMNPPTQILAVDEIVKILSDADNEHSSAYQKAADEYKKKITAKETEIKGKLDKVNLSAVNVLGSAMQIDFLQWVGLNVVGTYGEADSLTPQVVKDLVDKGKASKVSLVIDNLQNGADVGKGIAEELGAKRITISNFPGGFANTETWEKAIDYNISLLLDAIK
ncbi:MAG: metal ABC transporter substrate-binding protein [Dehalococcoidales bacterium]|nr:metal ABC transporter substrate-binding protein [Dehalococcoidales bacterium]